MILGQHRALITAPAAVLAIALVACGSGGGASEKSASIEGPEPSCDQRDGGTAKLAMATDLITWDINQQPAGTSTLINATNLVFDRLLRPTADLEGFENRLATSIDHNADFTRWTLKLRPGVKFQDGSSLDAGDVVFSIDYYLKGASGFAFGPVKDVKAIDKLTVEVDYGQPYADLPGEALASFSGSIIPSNFGGRTAADFWQKPIGTGPFQIVSSRPSSEVELERNPAYWDGAPHLDGIDLKIVADANDRTLGLEGGAFDLIDTVSPDSIGTLGGDSESRVLKPSTITDVLLLSASSSLLRDHDVRRAMTYAIDRDSVVAGAYNELADATTQLIPDAQPYTSPPENPPSFDLDKAKQLMADSEHSGGGQATLIYQNGDPPLELEAQILAQQLAEIGIDVQLQPLGSSVYFDQATTGDFEIALTHSESVIADPYDLLSFDVATQGFFGGWPTAYVGKLATEFSSTDDPQRLTDIVQLYENYVTQQARQIPVVSPFWLNAQSARLANLRMSLINEWYLDQAWLC